MSSDEMERKLDELMAIVKTVAAEMGRTKPFESRVVTYAEAARLLKKSTRTVERMVEDGVLLPSHVPGRIPLSEIDRLSGPKSEPPERSRSPDRARTRPARETAESEKAKLLAALKKPRAKRSR